MKHIKQVLLIAFSLMMVFALIGCGGNNEAAVEKNETTEVEKDADTQGLNLRDMLMMLYTSENDLELTDKYTSTADIPDANIDPVLIGTWKTADGSMAYTFHDDGTAKASMERYGDNEFTFTCFVCDDYNLIAQDTEMTDYSNDEEKTIPVVSYSSYKVENDVLYFTVVESVSEYMNQSITQIVVLYKADENGDITSAVNKNPVSLASFYGEWTYGENEDGKFVIDENGFALDGGKAIPIAYNEFGKLVIGDMNNVTEYSTGLGLERLYDNTNGLELTGENYVLAVSYTGSDEKDRPNLADAMDDWHADYGYDELYFSLNAKTPLN